ncbi:MAG: sulfurtransferase [Corynebacterium sp.]|nr:sulfurtransferase [Corynebacterium sp.]
MSLTISVPELAQRVEQGSTNIILASLWSPEDGGGEALFNSEHIPTARYCDAVRALASAPSSVLGRNPLPTKDILDRWFVRWGITDDRQVIVYDNGRGLFAARAWWILRWAGVEDVRYLNGGQHAWESAGYEVLGGPGNARGYSNIESNPGQLPVASIDEVKEHQGILLDAREPNRFAGRKEFLDLKAGHIPGAINLPARAVVDEYGEFKEPAELREIFAAQGVTEETIDDVIIYSGSGNHSAQVILGMNIAGLGTPRHFVGGWSQWCADPENPVEV